MNLHALYHRPQSEYAFPVSLDRAVIRFRAARDDLKSVRLVVKYKYNEKPISEAVMRKRFSDTLFDYYEHAVDTDRGRRLYYFVLTDNCGNVMYYTETGALPPEDIPEGYFPHFQIPFVSASDVVSVPQKFRNTVIYQIFPDRFYTASPKTDWGKRPRHDDYFGGDLWGAAEKLDHISSLGMNAVYLTPITASRSNHRYDVEDYYSVDERLGGDSAFAAFVDRAHALGIKVILDGVFNHCSAHNRMFADVRANGKRSEFYDWFIIKGDVPQFNMSGGRPDCNYETFAWNAAYMPKLNCDNGKVRAFAADVAAHWIKKFGVDAWRLDVGDDVSIEMWREVRRAIKAADGNAIMIGENWMDPRAYLSGGAFDGVMNYGFLRAVRDWLAYKKTDAIGAAQQLVRSYLRVNSANARMMMNLIDSHDTHRFYTLCGDDMFAYHSALAVMFFYDGMPTVYYGDELPLSGDSDPDCRRGFDWSRTGSETSRLIKTLADMRRGEADDAETDIRAENGALVMTRTAGGKTNSLAVNATDRTAGTALGDIPPRSAFAVIDGNAVKLGVR